MKTYVPVNTSVLDWSDVRDLNKENILKNSDDLALLMVADGSIHHRYYHKEIMNKIIKILRYYNQLSSSSTCL